MNFDSPGADGAPIREILHGSEEGYIPEASKRGQLTNRISAKAKVRGQSMSPPAPTRKQTSISSDTTDTSQNNKGKTEFSVEPFTLSPSRRTSQPPDFGEMSTSDLCNYLESIGCTTTTIQKVVQSEITCLQAR